MTFIINNIDSDDKDSIELWNKLVVKKSLPPQACYIWKKHLENIFDLKTFSLLVIDEKGDAKGLCIVYFTEGDEILYSCRYGFYAESEDVVLALQNEIINICRCNNLRKTHITSGSLDVVLNGKKETKDSLYLPLEYLNKDDLWLSVPKKTKNMIRKAEKSGFTISYDWAHLERFYEIYTGRFLEKSLSLKPFSHFLSIKESFGKDAILISAFHEDKFIAGMIFISTGEIVSYAYNASIVNALNNGINNLLMWEAMRIFHESGAKYIDLSESKPDSSVFKFKSRLSKDIELKKIYYYDILCGVTGCINWKLFLRYKVYGILHRAMPFMTRSMKKKYLGHIGKRGRVI